MGRVIGGEYKYRWVEGIASLQMVRSGSPRGDDVGSPMAQNDGIDKADWRRVMGFLGELRTAKDGIEPTLVVFSNRLAQNAHY